MRVGRIEFGPEKEYVEFHAGPGIEFRLVDGEDLIHVESKEPGQLALTAATAENARLQADNARFRAALKEIEAMLHNTRLDWGVKPNWADVDTMQDIARRALGGE